VIDALVARTGQPTTTLLGPGDDCAIVAAADGRVVATVDVLVDGVHFRTDWASGEQIGRRAALASMADVAAMGATPTALLVGLCAPAETPTDLVMDIGRGLDAEASKVGAGIVGGDITRSTVLTISVTVLGDLAGREPVRRSGARVGDVVAVVGWAGRPRAWPCCPAASARRPRWWARTGCPSRRSSRAWSPRWPGRRR
jgi:thiamine-monophosphate kinase